LIPPASLAELASQTGTYEEVVVADAASLPFADDTFDLVLAFMSLQDMDDAAGALRQAARVLIPKGRVVAAFVHPFAPAHLGRDATFRRSYFDVQRTLDEVERDGIAFAFHQIHRPLHAWLALFLDAGLCSRTSANNVPAMRTSSPIRRSPRHGSRLHFSTYAVPARVPRPRASHS